MWPVFLISVTVEDINSTRATPCSFELFSQINSHLTVFFSHNKPANNTFSHNNPAKRTGCKTHNDSVKGIRFLALQRKEEMLSSLILKVACNTYVKRNIELDKYRDVEDTCMAFVWAHISSPHI
jgi:hypothetical protein